MCTEVPRPNCSRVSSNEKFKVIGAHVIGFVENELGQG